MRRAEGGARGGFEFFGEFAGDEEVGGGGPSIGDDVPLDELVRAHARRGREKHGKDATKTARVLGISRHTVRKKLEGG